MSQGQRGVGPDRGRGLILPQEVLYQTFNTRIDYTKVEQLIDSRMAYDFLWARALKCSCRAADQTDQPDPTCAVCRGDGWRYVHPHPEEFPEYCAADGSVNDYQGQPIRGLMPSIALDFAVQDHAGVWYEMKAQVTVKGAVQLGHWDRLIMKDAEAQFDQTLVRQVPDAITIGRHTDTQIRYPVTGVTALHTLTTRYRERTDFNVDYNPEDGTGTGRVIFVPGKGPGYGERFSIRYTFHPIWIVTGFPAIIAGSRQRTRDSGDYGDTYGPLPQTASLALDFVTP